MKLNENEINILLGDAFGLVWSRRKGEGNALLASAAQCTLHYSSLLSERLCLTDGFNLFAEARLFSASSVL